MIYFDDAATSRYKPTCVKRALTDSLRHAANPGRGSHRDAIRAARIVEETRESLARHVNAKRANVIFTKNCTEALNLAILGTARLGGHVVTTAWEHNSVLRPLSMLKKEGLISLTVVEGKGGRIAPKDLLAVLTDKTYLVAVTAMSNVTGYATPLGAIGEMCRTRGIRLLVDGAQALGHGRIDCDGIGIDMLAGAGHKGLHGVMGTGFLIYKHVFITPLTYGGTGTESDNLLQPSAPPESLESGTLNYPGIAALKEGLRWTEHNMDKIGARTSELSYYIHSALKEAGIETYSVAGSPIVSFRIKGRDSATIADELNERYGIATRAGLHCAPLAHRALGTLETGLVRASIGCAVSRRDARALIRAIKEIGASTKVDE